MEKELTTYQCAECGKEFEAPYNRWCHFVRCECGAQAFDISGNTRTSPMTKI